FERVDRRRAVAEAPVSERDATRLAEVHGERHGEARRAGVGLLVVVLRRDAYEVLEAELEVERSALGGVARGGDRGDLEPPAGFVERVGGRDARHLAKRAHRRLELGARRGLVAMRPASPERSQTSSESASRDRAAVSAQDAPREPIPDVLPL